MCEPDETNDKLKRLGRKPERKGSEDASHTETSDPASSAPAAKTGPTNHTATLYKIVSGISSIQQEKRQKLLFVVKMDKGKELVGEDGGYASQTGSEAEEEEEEEVVVQPQVTVEGTTGVKRWVVDLDLPPEERWSEVVAFHAPDLLAVAQHIRSELARVRPSLYS